MHLYETVVAYFARRPDVEVVTCGDVLAWVEPLHIPYSRTRGSFRGRLQEASYEEEAFQ